MAVSIPTSVITKQARNHPWINQRCMDLVNDKIIVEGTEHYDVAVKFCADGLYDEYVKYIERMHKQLRRLRYGCKKWWNIS